MAVLNVLQLKKGQYDYNGSCLRTPSQPLDSADFNSLWLKKFLADMFETLYTYPSGVGLAANQVGVLLQICVIDIKRDGKSPLVLINPEYTGISEERVTSQEVCLSFPNIATAVQRYKKIHVSYYDYWGQKQELSAEGFKSYVLQHEIDHLKGHPHIDINEEQSFDYYPGFATKLSIKAIDNLLNGEKE